MFTFIHAADIHLDSPLTGLERYEGAPVEEIRGATRCALENLVALAIDRKVDFVLIAGDLYDGDWRDHNTGLFFVAQMTRLRQVEIPVIIIRGNHDAASQVTMKLRMPENVTVLSHKRPESIENETLRKLGVAIHGQSFAKKAVTDRLACEYPDREAGMFNIGLLHTSLTGAEGHEPYAPCSLDDLRGKGYDYWALGHVHNRGIQHEDPHIVFSGNIQGRHIRECGEKGCYMVTVEDEKIITCEFQPLDVFRWERCEVSADGAEHGDEVLDRFATALAELTRKHNGIPLAVRVEVTGRCQAHDQLTADQVQWTNQIRSTALDVGGGRVWVEKVKFQTGPEQELDIESLADGPVGELMQYLTELSEDDEQLRELSAELDPLQQLLPDELKQGAEKLLLTAPDRLREVLKELGPLLFSRLMKEVK